MVQLSLMGTECPTSFEGLLDELSRRHAPGHARAARDAARTRFEAWRGGALNAEEERRVTAYFEAVVRRRIISRRDEESVRARRELVRASIEADLRAAGWSAARAAGEALRVVGDPVPEGTAA